MKTLLISILVIALLAFGSLAFAHDYRGGKGHSVSVGYYVMPAFTFYTGSHSGFSVYVGNYGRYYRGYDKHYAKKHYYGKHKRHKYLRHSPYRYGDGYKYWKYKRSHDYRHSKYRDGYGYTYKKYGRGHDYRYPKHRGRW